MTLRSLHLSILTSLALVLGLGGCASSSYPGSGPAAMIRVNNEQSNVPFMTVYLVPSMGTPDRLGTVGMNQSEDFRVQRTQLAGTYRLWARPEGRRSFYSPEFNLARGDILEWDVRMNHVFYKGTVEIGLP